MLPSSRVAPAQVLLLPTTVTLFVYCGGYSGKVVDGFSLHVPL